MSEFENYPPDPIEEFRRWFSQIKKRSALNHFGLGPLLSRCFPAASLLEPEVVALATASAEAQPSVRMVLFKGLQKRSFCFYTNIQSQKASDLAENPRAALCFYWAIPPRQIRVEGDVSMMTFEETEVYWKTRPRGSQLSSLASRQSHVLSSRQTFLDQVNRLEAEYERRKIECPDFWRGYKIEPFKIEFWKGRRDRAHERVCYTKTNESWERSLLYP